MDAHQKALAKAAHRHAQQIEQDLLRDYPRLWRELDDLRSAPPVTWPDWCLLPMGAPATIMTSTRFGDPTPPIAVAAALYAWRSPAPCGSPNPA
ncbi:hypothetical protein [Virgisporangium aurantiacum]|uniref:Uncharacterized protein n=1 Tax=Virgisporangium aurantiacum TaxID=175570 RepID=A0A8J4E8S4_9ACTN|nr:hypothetical protein [Virgisporangium aurantiacum]GIJ63057.1 hypothetical protein Vau01_105730 [Virgisporangium aurantiacum]